MRRELIIQLILTAIALLLLLIVILFKQPEYHEEYPEGITASMVKIPGSGSSKGEEGLGPMDAETMYGVTPTGAETVFKQP
jgi:hypothetical protein